MNEQGVANWIHLDDLKSEKSAFIADIEIIANDTAVHGLIQFQSCDIAFLLSSSTNFELYYPCTPVIIWDSETLSWQVLHELMEKTRKKSTNKFEYLKFTV